MKSIVKPFCRLCRLNEQRHGPVSRRTVPFLGDISIHSFRRPGLSSINVLPDDLLKRIFAEVVYLFDSATLDLAVNLPVFWLYAGVNRLRYRLLSVCSRWRTIIHDTPVLWSSIVLDFFSPYYSHLLDQSLQLSKDCPLDVYIRRATPRKASPLLTPYLLRLKKEERRIRIIVSYHMYHDELLALFPIGQDVTSHYTSLKVFHLTECHSFIMDAPPMGKINAPNLRYLHIPESIILACFMNPLLPLRFLDVWENVFSMPALFFIEFLKKCPQLVYIHFALGRQYYLDGPSWPESRITMPLLRYLNFESFAGQNPMLLLRSLHLPALEMLDFGEFLDHVGAVSKDPTFKQQLIWYFLPETSATLKTLILHGGCIPAGSNIVEPLLVGMRNVQTLSFMKTEVKQSFLELLIPSNNEPRENWVMPCLTSIRLFETDIEGDALFRVIRSRALSDAEIRIIQTDSKDGLTTVYENDPLRRKTLREVEIWKCAILEDATFSQLLAIKETHSHVVNVLTQNFHKVFI